MDAHKTIQCDVCMGKPLQTKNFNNHLQSAGHIKKAAAVMADRNKFERYVLKVDKRNPSFDRKQITTHIKKQLKQFYENPILNNPAFHNKILKNVIDNEERMKREHAEFVRVRNETKAKMIEFIKPIKNGYMVIPTFIKQTVGDIIKTFRLDMSASDSVDYDKMLTETTFSLRSLLKKELREGSIKFNLIFNASMELKGEIKERNFHSFNIVVLDSSDILTAIKESFEKIRE